MAGEYRIGYVRVSQFNSPTARELAKALDELEKQGMQAFVLDLRNNPGGLVDSAVQICGEFLPEGTVVVTTEGRVASQNPPPYRTPPRGGKEPRKFPMAVLINHGSASASELTAGALQDLKRAIVVGTTSFGKGSVQTILPMKNGAAMRLTTRSITRPATARFTRTAWSPTSSPPLLPEEEAASRSGVPPRHRRGRCTGTGQSRRQAARTRRGCPEGRLVFDAFVAWPLAPPRNLWKKPRRSCRSECAAS
ncbi:MAG: hypothetical protein IPK22_11000 [Verrucomicrobiaceae bacterium]|nr:hypothetical protein [Verrucomicrobiaceae bacterium]